MPYINITYKDRSKQYPHMYEGKTCIFAGEQNIGSIPNKDLTDEVKRLIQSAYEVGREQCNSDLHELLGTFG